MFGLGSMGGYVCLRIHRFPEVCKYWTCRSKCIHYYSPMLPSPCPKDKSKIKPHSEEVKKAQQGNLRGGAQVESCMSAAMYVLAR